MQRQAVHRLRLRRAPLEVRVARRRVPRAEASRAADVEGRITGLRCGFCGGGDDSSSADRLIFVDRDSWAHLNCCLWSSEAFAPLPTPLPPSSAFFTVVPQFFWHIIPSIRSRWCMVGACVYGGLRVLARWRLEVVRQGGRLRAMVVTALMFGISHGRIQKILMEDALEDLITTIDEELNSK